MIFKALFGKKTEEKAPESLDFSGGLDDEPAVEETPVNGLRPRTVISVSLICTLASAPDFLSRL